MVAEIKVMPGIEVGELLNAADEGPVVLERDGTRYRLVREGTEDDFWNGYEPDPERVRAALDATAGSWSDLDVDKIIEDIYEAREQGSRPFDRP